MTNRFGYKNKTLKTHYPVPIDAITFPGFQNQEKYLRQLAEGVKIHQANHKKQKYPILKLEPPRFTQILSIKPFYLQPIKSQQRSQRKFKKSSNFNKFTGLNKIFCC